MRVVIASVILFLSGCSALLFQTLWLRLSGLVFGNSIWSAALILSSFMAGLALGSAIAALSTVHSIRPFRVYAGLEILVAIFGCMVVFELPVLGQWLRPLFQALWPYQGVLNVLRFSFSFLLLLVPATAMGLTLPVLLEDPLLNQRQFGQVISFLYGANTLGAVAGALAGEGYLIGLCGLFGTGLTAAAMSCCAAAIAWLSAQNESAPKRSGPARDRIRIRLSLGKRPPWALLLVSMGTGAVFLALEIIWFRFMRLYVASTSTAFCTMLAVVLAGIGIGGISAGIIPYRSVSPRRVLPFLLLLAAIATLLSYALFPVPASQGNTGAFHIETWWQIARLSVALIFPIAFLSGILLPTIANCVQNQLTGRMNSAGLTLLFNTGGAVAGSIVAAFVLLPRLGFQTSLIFCAACYALLAVLSSEKRNWSLRTISGMTLPAVSAALVFAFALFPYSRAEKHFQNARRPYEADGSVLQKKIEGTADTLQLLRRDLFGQPYYYRLVTNAYSMSGTHPRSQRYMRLFAYLPLTIRPQSENALLICYGVGVTADAFLHDAQLKHLDIVDISKEVFDLAGAYSGPNYANPLRDPRVTAFVQDGRFFLQAAPERYDIITGEPPPLKVAGTVNLYTQEFFSLMRDRLKDGGVATFWLPIYQLTTDETKAILRAFRNVFPDSSVWSTCDLEWIMLGIKGTPSPPDPAASAAFWSDANVRSDLGRIGIETPEQMSGLFLMDGPEIDRITQGIEPLSDFFPKRLTDVHPSIDSAFEFAHTYFEKSAARRRFLASPFIKEAWPNELKKSLELSFLVRETRLISELSGSNWLAELDLYLRQTHLRTPVLAVQNSDEFRLALAENVARDLPAPPPDALHDLVAGALARRELDSAIHLLESERESGFPNLNDFFLLTYLYCLHGDVDSAEALAATKTGSIEKDWFVNWLWGKLQAEFGFRPPR